MDETLFRQDAIKQFFRRVRVNPAFFTRAGRAMRHAHRLPEIKDTSADLTRVLGNQNVVQFVKIPPPRSGPRETANTFGPIGQGLPGKRSKSGAVSQSKKRAPGDWPALGPSSKWGAHAATSLRRWHHELCCRATTH